MTAHHEVAQDPVLRIALAGCGRWGQNIARNLANLGVLAGVIDADNSAGTDTATRYGVPVMELSEALASSNVDALVIATPASEHAGMARRALRAEKHVLVEKPLALSTQDAEDLFSLARERGRILMVGHLLRYHPAFEKLKALVDEGFIGRLQYLYSHRLNLGQIRRVEDSLWSFAPHDISMILALVGAQPTRIEAVGAAHLHETLSDVTTTHLKFPAGQRAHIFVSWLHPYREQRLVVIGDSGMLVFDDTKDWSGKLQHFSHRIDWREGSPEPRRAEPENIAVEPAEPLMRELAHFLTCVRTGSEPTTNGREGVAVVRVLEEASSSMRRFWTPRIGADENPLSIRFPTASIHPSCFVDEDVTIGPGSQIWHYSHIMRSAHIGARSTLGQNVMVGAEVRIGSGCKIQNNVSIYQGVTIEDDVFCGPSCVFTNVINPRAFVERKNEFLPTVVEQGASIGANATIVCGNRIGSYALVGAGAVVTKDVPAHALVVGSPARQIGWVSHIGGRLDDALRCPLSGATYALTPTGVLEQRETGA